MSSTQEQQTVVPSTVVQKMPLVCFGTDKQFVTDSRGNAPIIIVMVQELELTLPLIKLLFNKEQREFIFQDGAKSEVLTHNLELEEALNFFYKQVQTHKDQGVNISSLLFSPYAHLDYAHYKVVNSDTEAVSTVKLKDNKTTKQIFLNKKHPFSPHYSIH